MSKLNIVKINLRDVLIYSSQIDNPVLEIQVDFPEYHKKDFNDKNKSIRISACSKLYYLHILSNYAYYDLFITPSLYKSKTIVSDTMPIVDSKDYDNIRNVLVRSTKSILIDFLQSKEIYNFSAYKINISNILEESNDVISDFADTALIHLKMYDPDPDIDISEEEKDIFYKHKIIKEEEE